MDTYVGFDSAWTDKPKAPGAICALTVEDGRPARFYEPRLTSFTEALQFIGEVRSEDGVTLVALDQPTIVPNATSMRPVERVAASLVSWLGGGVQPANTGKVGMFCAKSPIWPFLRSLSAREDPEAARRAETGLHLIEVFPAISMPTLEPSFYGYKAGPRYNPARRKTFRHSDWKRVAQAAADRFDAFGAGAAATWCANETNREKPGKADQDRLDAMLCLLVGLRWRLSPREDSLMIGTLSEGYMICPASSDVRVRISLAAARYGVPVQ